MMPASMRPARSASGSPAGRGPRSTPSRRRRWCVEEGLILHKTDKDRSKLSRHLDKCLALLRRQFVHFHAVLLQRIDRLGDIGRVVFGFPGLRLDGRFLDRLLVGIRQRLEARRIYADDPSVSDVVADGQILLHFVEPGADRHVDGILLTVDDLQLKRVVNFGERHRRRRGTHGAEKLDPERVVGHAQLHARQDLQAW